MESMNAAVEALAHKIPEWLERIQSEWTANGRHVGRVARLCLA
jgi:hypothetical protein